MNRYKIENYCTYIAVVALAIMTIGGILAIADAMFGLNIFPRGLEMMIGFFFAILGVLVVSSVMISIMVNISIVAMKITAIDQKIGAVEKHVESVATDMDSVVARFDLFLPGGKFLGAK